MTKLLTQTITSNNESETEQLAARIGKSLHGGEVIELIGDLGSGKTTFVRGLAVGIGSSDHVASPTFTINRIYKSPKLTIYHFDFYRLDEAGIVKRELQEVLEDKQAVVVIEWGNVVKDALSIDRMTIKLSATGENSRKIIINYLPKFKKVISELG